MKKIIIAFLLFSLLLPLAYSIPTVTVIKPNGGELIAGTTTINWTMASPQNSQDLNALLYYSLTTGGQQENIISDLNVFNSCSFDSIQFWKLENDKRTGWQELWTSQVGGLAIPRMFNFANENYIIAREDTGKYHGFKWNGTTWVTNQDINSGLNLVDTTIRYFYFEIDGSLYGLGTTVGFKHIGLKYDGGTWVFNADINSGLIAPTFERPSMYKVRYNLEDWLIINEAKAGETPVTKSYYWNETLLQWANLDTLTTNFSVNAPSQVIQSLGNLFISNNELYGLFQHGADQTVPYTGIKYNSASEQWEGNSDINFGLTTHPQSNAFYIMVDSWEATGIPSALTTVLLGLNDVNSYDLTTGINTISPVSCSSSWDTTTVPNGRYAVDVNILDRENSISAVDSSNGLFTLINWTDSDILCQCVSNCSSCSLDVNTFAILPIEETNDVRIKVVNGNSIKNIGYRLNNTINNNKQYFIHTSGNGTEFSLNDTITYGSTTENGVQKIWIPDDSIPFFQHSFIDIIKTNEEKYYDLRFRSPMLSWDSMTNNADWDVSFIPQQTDLNGHLVDQYQVSSYSNIRNELIEEIPNISGSINSGNYVFQVNAKTDTSTGTILAGQVNSKGTNPSTSATIITKEIRYNFSSISKGILSIVSNELTSRLYTLSDYALVQRGYFTKGFKISNKHGGELELFVDDSNMVHRFLIEGEQFKLTGQLYDRSNSIDFMEVSAFLETDSDANKVLYEKIDLDDVITLNEEFLDFEIDLEGIFDLTGNTLSFKDLIIEIKVTDLDQNHSEIQHSRIKLRQFPFLPGDLFLGIDLINKLKSEHPAGRIVLRSTSPEAIRGLNFRFLTNPTQLPNSDFNITLYKDVDFTCLGKDCSFDFELDTWIFPKYGQWRFVVSTLLTTQNEDLNNSRTTKTLNFFVNFKEFKMAKIVETRERTNHDYKPTERIPLALILQDSDGADLRNQLNVYLTVEDCNSSTEELGIENASGCEKQTDLNYSWKEHLYDETTGINYYFFESLMLKDFQTVFSDSNYMRVVGHVQDAKNQHVETDFNPLLATKCKSNVNTNCHALDVFCFVGSALTSALEYGLGCLTENGKIITFDVNGSQEGRIDWDSTKSPAQPNLECFGCINADNNNLYENNLEQRLLCGGWYTLGEQSVDKLTFRIGNDNSDYSETNDDLKQYLEMDIPYSLIYYNDPILLKKGLELNFSTGTCSEIQTLGELMFCGLDDLFTGVANPLSDVFTGATSTGFITNVGSDCNFSNAFDPNFLDGIFFVSVDGLKVTNMRDYYDADDSIEDSDPSRFFKTLRDLGIDKKEEQTEIKFYGNDRQVFKKEKVQSNLVIDEEYTDLQIIEGNIDPDSVLPNYRTLPTILKFNVFLDMIFDDETTYIRRSVPIFITTTILPDFGSVDAIKRSLGKGLNEFLENPVDALLMIPFDTIFNLTWWALGGWFWIFLIGGGITLIILYRGSRSGN